MDPGLIASTLGGMMSARKQNRANLLNNLLSSATSIYNTHKTNKANMQLAEYSYQKDYEQWLRETEYNTPLNQMKRYQEAGLNPNLIYSQGNPGNSSVSSPNYNAPNLSYAYDAPKLSTIFDFINIIGQYQNFRILSAQEQKTRQETQNLHSQNDVIVADALLKQAQEAKTNQEYELAKRMEETAVKIQKEQYKRYQADAVIADSQARMQKSEADFFTNFDNHMPGTGPGMKYLMKKAPGETIMLYVLHQLAQNFERKGWLKDFRERFGKGK